MSSGTPVSGDIEGDLARRGEATLPELAEGEVLELVTPPGVLAEQKFTQPPARYNDETVKCDFKLWQKPIPEPCPACNAKFLVIGGTKAKPMIACADKECGYKRPFDSPPPLAQPDAGAEAGAAGAPA